MLNKNHKIYIITDFAFPVGFAGASRIQAYAKGFSQNSIETLILIIRKTESPENILNKNSNGSYHGIKYRYLSKSTIKSKFKIKRGFDNYLMVLRFFFFCLFKVNKNSTIIFYSSLTHAALWLKLASIIRGFKILKEENEHPTVRIRTKGRAQGFAFKRIHYNLFDGIIVITRRLYDYFNSNNFTIPILQIPMLVDLKRFDIEVEKEKTITYSGMISDHKDGIGILMKSFSDISNEFKDYSLTLIGVTYTSPEMKKYENLASELQIAEKVNFVGRVPNDDIPEAISKAGLLVLPRPDSVQAQNGFPTKLGEYLATGIPVIVTSVGEIPLYLKDNENAFIAVPGSIDSLTDKLREALINPDHSNKIGRKGRKVAEEFFDNELQVKKILAFISEL